MFRMTALLLISCGHAAPPTTIATKAATMPTPDRPFARVMERAANLSELTLYPDIRWQDDPFDASYRNSTIVVMGRRDGETGRYTTSQASRPAGTRSRRPRATSRSSSGGKSSTARWASSGSGRRRASRATGASPAARQPRRSPTSVARASLASPFSPDRRALREPIDATEPVCHTGS